MPDDKPLTGKKYWRSLEELGDSPAFQEILHREYPRYAALLHSGMTRRDFLKLLGASLALAGLSACGVAPAQKIVPYVKQPAEYVPGKPLYYATAMTLNGYARGVLVENQLGRPVKIEGNPGHPASLGGTDAFTQASILSLYDPDRSQVVTLNGQISTWENFFNNLRALIDKLKNNQGAGIRILTETTSSPTMADQLGALLRNFPNAQWHQYDPAGRDNARAGARLAFGQSVETIYHLERADVILSLDADFLVDLPGSLRYAHDFAARRQPDKSMTRLYVIESTPTLTGAKADHRLPLRAGDIELFARALASTLGAANLATGNLPSSMSAKWLPALARDLQQHRGTSVVIPGETQPPIVHAIAHALNNALGNVGATVTYADAIPVNPIDQMNSLRDLVNDLQNGRVELLMILGGNPAYNAPVDLHFGEAMLKAGTRVHLSLYEDETSALCQWHIPQAHYLETWSDARADDGTLTIMQPLIAPLYAGKSELEMLALFGDTPNASSHDLVQTYWKNQLNANSAAFENFWRTALNNGTLANTARKSLTPTWNTNWQNQPAPPVDLNALEINFRIDPSVHDGRFANNGWLQELPKPFIRLTWDNVVLVSPVLAQRLNLSHTLAGEGGEHGAVRTDVVEINYRGQKIRAPIWITPGQPDNSITVFLGYGRTRAGKIGTGIGYNAYRLRTSNAPWFDTGVELRKTGEQYELASVQQHNLMEGRGLVRMATLDEFRQNPNFAHIGETQDNTSLFTRYPYNGYAWGMAIDLNACIGCNACVVACQSENNIPIVGKDQVLKAREMHWLRIDTYYSGEMSNPQTDFEPVPCMQCENAPCELVCPVGATVHSSEGLNDMVYNRCVGTRYCSNNCPYKVRRFNFLQFADWDTASLKAMRNPEVTVRSRGVMEKCTYCVQRINHARITAEKEGRTIRDGEVVPACTAACPANAIVFGDINDENSRIAKLKASPRNYALLAELNTHPRTTYLAAVRNPNPELA